MAATALVRRLRNDEGSVLIAAAIAMLVMALLGTAVVQVGDWFQHRRHIQVRADAAALAGGQVLATCFNVPSSMTEQQADSAIEAWAQSYGGFSTTDPESGAVLPARNTQFGPSADNSMWFQSDTYPSSSEAQPATSRTLGNECFDGNGNPNLMLDVKMTQGGIPALFSIAPLATVHGWARVALQSITSTTPTMPLAIPDVNPKAVAVTFVDQSTGDALPNCANPGCVFPLGPPQLSGSLNSWGGSATITVPGADTNIGIRVSIGSQYGSCAHVNSTATYTCFDYSNTGGASQRGIVAIRSYSTASVSGTAPILRSVTPVTCVPNDSPGGTPYFSAYQAPGGTCDYVGVTAAVDFPSGATSKQVTSQITQGNCNPSTKMTLQSGNVWASSFSSLSTSQGAYDVCLGWRYKDSSGTSHQGTFGAGSNGSPVQQIFSGSDGSDLAAPGGPIMAASVTDNAGNGYSLPAGATETLNIAIGLTGGVHLPQKCSDASGNSGAAYVCPSDPPVRLRFQTTGSLTYAVDCGTLPGHNGGAIYQQIRYGCSKSFSLNTADVCPDPANPTPPSCAPVQTGAAVGQLQQAMNDRFAPNGTCDPNNYPNVDENDDQRVVTLIDTDFSAFSGSGGSSKSDVPVVTFAAFYVTGWDGSAAGCSTINEPPPAGFKAKGNTADVWGHFIKYTTIGTPKGQTCVITSIAPCVAALVR